MGEKLYFEAMQEAFGDALRKLSELNHRAISIQNELTELQRTGISNEGLTRYKRNLETVRLEIAHLHNTITKRS